MEAKIEIGVEARVVSTPEILKQFKQGEIGAVLDWQIRDAHGNITSSGIKKSESFTRGFFDLLMAKLLGATHVQNLSVTDINNVLREIGNSRYMFACDAAIGSVSTGIIVGTGNAAPTISDYKIQTIIAHDSGAHGAGTLQYSAVTFGAPSSDSTTSQFTITRNFANGTAGSITVNEIALYVKGTAWDYWADSTGQEVDVMTIRDVIVGGLAVPAGQTLTVNYRPQAVV